MIPVNEPILDGNEKKYLCECIDTGWISSEGPFVKRLEEGFAARVGRKFGITVCNGSAALDAAVAAAGIGPDDQVIMPAFTIISCAFAVVRAGGIPVLVDSHPQTWNIDIDALREKLHHEIVNKGNRRIKAIMPVHIYGLPVEMDPIEELAREYGLKIIEDGAEQHGQTFRGRPVGSFGDVSTFSFYPNKHMTTGEGGIIVTDDPAIADACRNLRNLYFDKERRYIHERIGWNLRFSNIQAAVGVAQLERLDEFILRKRSMGRLYTELLQGAPGIRLPVARTDYAENIYWVYGIVLEKECPFDAVEMMHRLKEKGVQTRHFFYPMHLQPVFTRMGLFERERYPVAEMLAQRGFYLPSGLALREEQIRESALALRHSLAA